MISVKKIPTILLSLLLEFHYCSSLAIERRASPSEPQLNGTPTSPNNCGFAGNPDLYGIGIRLGYYTQALSVWFANYFISREARELRSVNLLFLVALFIALVWLSRQSQQTYAIEVFLLLRLLFATWYVGVLDRSRFSKKHGSKRITRILIRECALLGMLSYTVWFAWIGLDRMEETPCGTWIFFLAKLNLYGGYRLAYKVLSIFALSFGMIKQCNTANQLSQHWRDAGFQSPDYFARLRQSLLIQHYDNIVACGDSPSEQNSHRRSEEDGHSMRNPDSGVTPSSVVLAGDEVDEGASNVSGKAKVPTSIPSDIPRQDVSDAAVQCHLPDCPPSDLHNHDQTPAITTSDPNLKDLPSLESLLEAQYWLEAIMAVDVADHSAWCYAVPCLPMKIFLPSIPSPTKIHRRISALFALRPFRLPILIPLACHLHSLRQFGWYNFPLMLEAALQHPSHKHISHPTLLATIAIHKAQLPTSRPIPHVLWSALASLAMCVELILSIELSLHWNRIGGLENVGAPGQLIPAIIGIGGLVKVGWVWWFSTTTTTAEDAVEEEGKVGDGVGRELKECVQVYRRLKREKEEEKKRGNNPDRGI